MLNDQDLAVLQGEGILAIRVRRQVFRGLVRDARSALDDSARKGLVGHQVVAVLLVFRHAPQGQGEAEFLILVAAQLGHNRLAHHQAALSAGVGEVGLVVAVAGNRADLAGGSADDAVDAFLSDLVLQAHGQAAGGNGLVVGDREFRDGLRGAVLGDGLEGHVAVSLAVGIRDAQVSGCAVGVGQLNGELVLLVQVGGLVGINRLVDVQAADLAHVLEGGFSTAFQNRVAVAVGALAGKQAVGRLDNVEGRAYGQILDDCLAAALDLDFSLALNQGDSCRLGHSAVLVVVAVHIVGAGQHLCAVQQAQGEGVLRGLLSRHIADHGLVNAQRGGVVLVGEGAVLGLVLDDGHIGHIAGGRGGEAGLLGLGYAVGVTRRDAGDGHGLVVLQVDGRSAVSAEDDIPGAAQGRAIVAGLGQGAGIGAGSRLAVLVLQGDGEGEFLGLVRLDIAVDLLGHGQAALVLGVDDGGGGHIYLADRAGLAGVTRGEAVSRGLLHGVGDARGQAGDADFVAVLDGEGRHTVSKFNVAVSSADGGIAQRHGHAEFLGLVGGLRADHGLGHDQVAGVAGVLKGGSRLDRGDGAALYGVRGRPVGIGSLGHSIGDAGGQAGDGRGLVFLQLNPGHAVSEGGIAVGSADGRVAQLNGEDEFLIRVAGGAAVGRLGDLQVALVVLVFIHKGDGSGLAVAAVAGQGHLAAIRRDGRFGQRVVSHNHASGNLFDFIVAQRQVVQCEAVQAVAVLGELNQEDFLSAAAGGIDLGRLGAVLPAGHLELQLLERVLGLGGQGVAGELLGQGQAAQVIVVLNRDAGRGCAAHRHGSDDKVILVGGVVPAHHHRDGLVAGVGHAGRGACGLSDLEGVSAGLGDALEREGAGLVLLDGQARAGFAVGLGRHAGQAAVRCCEIGQVDGEGLVAGIGTAGHNLLDRDFHIDLAVHQLGQEDQGHTVLLSVLLDFRLALDPAGGHSLNPAVLVAGTVFVHLIHADRDIGPVVGLVQGDAVLVGHVGPLGVVLGAQLALQLDGQGLAVRHGHFAVHQPLLGHRGAVLAGGVGVDQFHLCGFAADNHRILRDAAQVEQVGHVAHVARCVGRVNLLRAGTVRILLHLVGAAHRQPGELYRLARLQLIAGGSRQRHLTQLVEGVHFHRFRALRVGVARGHKVLLAVDLCRQHEEEALVDILAGLVRAVHEHALVDFQRAKLGRIGDGDFTAHNRAVSLLICAGTGAVSDRKALQAGLNHLVGDLISVVISWQVLPLDGQVIACRALADRLDRVVGEAVGQVAGIPVAVRVLAHQRQGHVLCQAKLDRILVPDLSGLNLGLLLLVGVGEEHLGEVALGQSDIVFRGHYGDGRISRGRKFGRSAVAAHLHGGGRPGVTGEYAVFVLILLDSISTQRQILQHQHAVVEVGIGEGNNLRFVGVLN